MSTKTTQKRRVSALRFGLGVHALLLWSALCIGAVMFVPHPAVGLVAGVLFTVPLISLWEWAVHELLYHRGISFLGSFKKIRQIHIAGHHHHLFPPKAYVQKGKYPFMRLRKPFKPWRMSETWFDSALTSWSQVALHFVVGLPTILLPAWLFSGKDTVFTLSTLGTLAFISWLLAYVHGCIHTPRNRLIEHMGWFQWLDRHHYIHHIDHEANINFLLPLCDVIFGTLKTELTARETARFPSFEEAKPMAKDVLVAARQSASEA